MAELQRKRAEQLRPLEVDKMLADILATLNDPGIWKQRHCNYVADNYCTYWRWKDRPDSPYQIGEPLLKEGNWYIRPTALRCAACPAGCNINIANLQNIELSLSTTERMTNAMAKAMKPMMTMFLRMAAALISFGRYNHQNCSHLENNYCTFWSWEQRPDDELMVGKPDHRAEHWYIQPTDVYCALCSSYQQKGT